MYPLMTREEAIQGFQKQLAQTVPGALRTADDLLELPPGTYRQVMRQLELEELEEAFRARS